jgi:hypothetical protein
LEALAIAAGVMTTPGYVIRDWIHGAPHAPTLMGICGPVGRSRARSARRVSLGVASWLSPGTWDSPRTTTRLWIATLYTDAYGFDDELHVLSVSTSIQHFLRQWPATLVGRPESPILTPEEQSALVLAAARS